MASIEQAEELVKTKQFAAARRICEQLQRRGQSGLRLDFLLGSIALFANDFEQAKAIFAGLAVRHPNHSGIQNNLGTALLNTGGDPDEAQILMERAIEIDPANVPALINLGELYLLRRRRDDSRRIYERIVELAPDNPQGYHGIGQCALSMNDFADALIWLEKAAKLAPHNPIVLASLLMATTQTRNHDKAVKIARLIAATPELEAQLPNAWAVLKRYCLWDEAAELLPKVISALTQEGVQPEYFSPIALELLSSDLIDHPTLKLLHTRCGEGLRLRNAGYAKEPNTRAFAPTKRMRIGYLSGDFRNHVASLFIRGVINHHDTSRFEIFLYSSAPVGAQDETTGKFFRVAEHFVHCYDMDDGELARQIARDGIHVLIDMSGFTSHTRMPVLTLQPAPVQMSYIGYPATYGLREVDYIICNRDLIGSDHDNAFVERPIELPGIYGITPSPPGVRRAAQLPLAANGFVTFGSLINPYKINRSTVALWSRVLAGVPNSRIYLNHPIYACETTRRSMIDAFAKEGIDASRLTVTDERPASNGIHFLLYDKVDIVLDATPMTGGAGTADALTVGVPVVSRIGSVFHERLSSAAICANVPTPEEYIAESDDDFVAKALSLAGNADKLRSLREEIRNNVLFGPNGQAEAFTRDLEDLHRRAWDMKFPETPIDSLCSWEQETTTIELPPFRFHLSAARNDLHRFVACEQGRWFEEECRFVAEHAAGLGTIWDVSDDPGLATIPIGARLQTEQSLTCLRLTPSRRQLLEQNIAENGLSSCIHAIASIADLQGQPLLLRLGAERNDGNAGLLQQVLSRIDGGVPIVLVSLDGANGPDDSSANFLAEHGYLPFRLHFACSVLVPAPADGERDGFLRNLFYIAPEALPLLEEHGLVCTAPASPTAIPGATEQDWQSIARPAHSTHTADQPHSEWADVYLSALNAYARARNLDTPPAERIGWFDLANNIVHQLIQAEPTAPRLLTAIRLANEGGRRDIAVNLAREVFDGLKGKHGRMLFEPYLLPFDSFETIQPNEDEALWCQSLCLVALEKLRSWSSFFTAAQSTLLWKELGNYPWWHEEAGRMLGILGMLWASGTADGIDGQTTTP
ncbi:MAG: tetratricopeptide repeat protein [Dechloromonas sp.]|nr:tetratricopeptide repeat protein [Dechloromonas sp.]